MFYAFRKAFSELSLLVGDLSQNPYLFIQLGAVAYPPQIGGTIKEMVNLTIPLEPVSKGRPRFEVHYNYVSAHTPPKTKRFEQDVALYYIQSNSPKFEQGTPISVSIEFGMAIPKSTTKKRKSAMLQGLIYHTVKPDLDNLTKAILDALNDLAWHDDAQIVELNVNKVYIDNPYIQLSIHKIT